MDTLFYLFAYVIALCVVGAIALPLGLWLRSREKRAANRRGFEVLSVSKTPDGAERP
jgi:hypothetical protein